jgi:hypothetical protein
MIQRHKVHVAYPASDLSRPDVIVVVITEPVRETIVNEVDL